MSQTDTSQFIGDLNGGVFEQQIGRALSDVALGVTTHGKKGKVVVTIDFSQIADSNQVKIKHKIDYQVPTAKGTRSEDYTTETPMHVGRGGRLTLFPENQNTFKFDNENA